MRLSPSSSGTSGSQPSKLRARVMRHASTELARTTLFLAELIGAGSGTQVADVNRLIKQFTQTKKVLKQLGSGPMMPKIPGLPGLPR